jgi:anti-sigma B factor antagonist
MPEQKLIVSVRRPNPFVCVIDLQGAITTFSEENLIESYAVAVESHLRAIIFNFSELSYINSLGIGLLVTLLIRARREGVTLVGYGLKEHYCKTFEITRLDQSIPIYNNEATAIAYATPMDLPEREY